MNPSEEDRETRGPARFCHKFPSQKVVDHVRLYLHAVHEAAHLGEEERNRKNVRVRSSRFRRGLYGPAHQDDLVLKIILRKKNGGLQCLVIGDGREASWWAGIRDVGISGYLSC